MKIAFAVNEVATEQSNYSTIRLAWTAVNAGHEVALIGLGDYVYHDNRRIDALATVPRESNYSGDKEFLDDIQGGDAQRAYIAVDDCDVLLLRSDPAEEAVDRPWASTSGHLFAQLAARGGVAVLNDPNHLTDAANKTYFQQFPAAVRPRTCISRDPSVIKKFIEDMGGSGVIKPLQGSGGQGVFVVQPDGRPNLNQMIEAVLRDGYALVQEYLPLAAEGDLRLILLNGKPLVVDGVYACFRRYNDGGDARSNVSAGGKVELAEPDADALKLAEIVGPKLIKDGMYLVGLDIVGDKMLEINVDTPGGINMAEDLTGIRFSAWIIDNLASKVRLKRHYDEVLDNVTLAML